MKRTNMLLLLLIILALAATVFLLNRNAKRLVAEPPDCFYERLEAVRFTQEYTAYRVYAEPDATLAKLTPVYLPENLELEQEIFLGNEQPTTYRVLYLAYTTDNTELYLHLTVTLGHNQMIMLDTEEAIIETVALQNTEAIVVWKNGATQIHWVQQGLLISLKSNLLYEEVLLVALSLCGE